MTPGLNPLNKQATNYRAEGNPTSEFTSRSIEIISYFRYLTVKMTL